MWVYETLLTVLFLFMFYKASQLFWNWAHLYIYINIARMFFVLFFLNKDLQILIKFDTNVNLITKCEFSIAIFEKMSQILDEVHTLVLLCIV